MTHTVIEVVVRREEIMLHRPKGFGSHVAGGQLTGGPPLPVAIHSLEPSLCLIGDVKGVCLSVLHRLKFRFQPLIGKLRIGLAASRGNCGTAHNELPLSYDDGDLFKYIIKGKGSS